MKAPTHAAMFWGAVIVSVFVMGVFSAVVILIFLKGSPQSDAANQIVGGIVQLAGMVVGFWVGSSAGSMIKTVAANGSEMEVKTGSR